MLSEHPLEIRPAVPQDAPALSAIDISVNPSPFNDALLQSICDGGGSSAMRALVAEQGGEIMGFIALSLVLDEASIDNLAVGPASQGRGIGRALVSAAIKCMADSGAALCHLEVRAGNLRARKLYESVGFRLDGLRKNYYRSESGREDACLLSLRIEGERRERTGN